MVYNLLNFNIHGDHNGKLVALEQGADFPFEIKRVYYIWGQIRGLFAENMLIENWNKL